MGIEMGSQMKEWFTEVVYVQNGVRGQPSKPGSHELTDLLNSLEKDGWDVQGVDVLDKYYVLVVAHREITARDVRNRLLRKGVPV